MDSESDTESDAYSVAASEISRRTSISSVSSRGVSPSVRSASPSSVVSIDSTMQLYRHEYGRELNNYSKVYNLPADQEEMDRLDLQHQLFIELFGEKYPACMTEILNGDGSPVEAKSCLDIGCGTGRWISEVARDFPHIKAVAVDLIPMQATNEVDDLNLGLKHYFGKFDVVHARLIAAGIRDYHRMVDQVAHVVRPGGLVDLSEFDFYIYDVNHERVLFNSDDDIGPPWWGRWMHLLHHAVKAKGGDVDAATNLYDWICQNPLFENVTYKEYWLPIVSEKSLDRNTTQGGVFDEKMKSNLSSFLASGRPLLLGQGIPEALITLLEEKAVGEMDERKIPQFTRLQCVTARRKYPPRSK